MGGAALRTAGGCGGVVLRHRSGCTLSASFLPSRSPVEATPLVVDAGGKRGADGRRGCPARPRAGGNLQPGGRRRHPPRQRRCPSPHPRHARRRRSGADVPLTALGGLEGRAGGCPICSQAQPTCPAVPGRRQPGRFLKHPSPSTPRRRSRRRLPTPAGRCPDAACLHRCTSAQAASDGNHVPWAVRAPPEPSA